MIIHGHPTSLMGKFQHELPAKNASGPRAEVEGLRTTEPPIFADLQSWKSHLKESYCCCRIFRWFLWSSTGNDGEVKVTDCQQANCRRNGQASGPTPKPRPKRLSAEKIKSITVGNDFVSRKPRPFLGWCRVGNSEKWYVFRCILMLVYIYISGICMYLLVRNCSTTVFH